MPVTIENNVFDTLQIQAIFSTVFHGDNTQKWRIHKHTWNPRVAGKSPGVIAIFNIEDPLRTMISNTLQRFLQEDEEVSCVMYYEWNQLSQINWHNDGRKKAAITVYLNETWDPDFGGFFCWREDSETARLFVPQFNSAVIVRGNPFHHVSLISPYAPVRKTLQVWIREKPS